MSFKIKPTGAQPLLPKGLLYKSDGNKAMNIPVLKVLESESARQESLTNFQKDRFISSAEIEEEKMPKLSVKSVTFSVLNSDILNKLSQVDVTSKIKRQPNSAVKDGFGVGEIPIKSCKRMAPPIPPESSVTTYTQMGTVDRDKLCNTCNKTDLDCPGHLGQINFNNIIFIHPLFKEITIKVLNSVCNDCSSLILSESMVNEFGGYGLSKLNKIENASKGHVCRVKKDPRVKPCTRNPEWLAKSEDHIIKYIRKTGANKKGEENQADMDYVANILNNISDKTAILLGFKSTKNEAGEEVPITHPRDFIMKSFPVIPPNARPYVIRDGKQIEDHLTACYDEIIRDNYKYDQAVYNNDENKKRNQARDLYFHISRFIDNSDGKYCRSPTEKIKSIKERITKKEGLIRGNIMGKRVNFCGRTVLGPDSDLEFGEVAIPREMSKILTVPEVVHERNLDYILKLWEDRKINYIYQGKGDFKGRRRLVKESFYTDEINGKKLRPQIGDTVDRQIEDGDILLVNRQPTLYKYSFIGDRVKLVDRKTLGIHMTETKMRNADFDGDEGNIHVIQAMDARVEAYTFANVRNLISNALTNSSMVGQVFNGITGAYLMTADDSLDIPDDLRFAIIEKIRKYTYKNSLDTLDERLEKYGVNKKSGRALFSAILPAGLFYKKADKNRTVDNKDKPPIEIKDGILVSGQIGKDHVGITGNTIQLAIWKWFGQEAAANFITANTFLCDAYILSYGLTFSYSSINIEKEDKDELDRIISGTIRAYKRDIQEIGPETRDMTAVEIEYREAQIISILDNIKKVGDKISIKSLKPDNPLNIIVKSGTKGSSAEIVKITGILGQQFYKGRSPKRITNRTRCIPYFEPNSEEIEARGFVKNSFLTGLEPSEMYFISEPTRVGTMNSAITTATTGFMHKRMVKVMEDVKVCYDGTVRNSNDMIYQFHYGDGYDIGELSATKFNNEEVVNFINLQQAFEKINHEFS
jgi:DNA-directed RNA polymerase beta' subunit